MSSNFLFNGPWAWQMCGRLGSLLYQYLGTISFCVNVYIIKYNGNPHSGLMDKKVIGIMNNDNVCQLIPMLPTFVTLKGQCNEIFILHLCSLNQPILAPNDMLNHILHFGFDFAQIFVSKCFTPRCYFQFQHRNVLLRGVIFSSSIEMFTQRLFIDFKRNNRSKPKLFDSVVLQKFTQCQMTPRSQTSKP